MIDHTRDTLAAAADPTRDAALLARLVEAGRAGREAIDTVTAEAMEAAGCTVETFEYDPADVPLVEEFAAPSASAGTRERCVIARMPGRGRSLLLFAHPDTEPFASDSRWNSDPFAPTVAAGRMVGWGVADDLAGIATMARTAALLAALPQRPDLTLISAPSKMHRCGIAAALARGLTAEGAVYCHPAESGRGLNEIKAFAPGQLEFLIRITGTPPDTNEPAHTAFAHRARNPLTPARRILDALEAVDTARAARLHHPRLDAAIGRSTNLMVTRCQFGDGEPLSRIAPTLTLGGALTLIPGETLAAAMDEVARAVEHADDTAAIEWLSGVSAAETPDEAPLYRTADAALRAVGARPRVNPLHTSSDIRNPIVQAGIPTVGFGPLCGGLTMAGNANEWVDLADFSRAILATATLAAAWAAS